MLTAMMGNWMLSSGFTGVTQLSASATGMSVPFLYITLKGRYGKDLTISLCTLGLMSTVCFLYNIDESVEDITAAEIEPKPTKCVREISKISGCDTMLFVT